MEKIKRVELLSPAGSFDCLKAAISNGANAVYLGGKNFSARAFANNFDENELIEAVKYAHLRNVKVYVTLNTLLNEYEFKNAIKMADFYYRNNVDALLVQDLGLYYYLKKNYPDFELHCSTQMHVHNLEGVKTAKKLGFKRAVIARESDLDFIKEACKQDIEIETFVHGAICVSYSGQCLISSVTKNRSANKGMCAQCCRLAYELKDQEDKAVNTSTRYLLSPKDMFLLNDIPKLIEAGVSSFKIEGRLKSAAYVGYVTSLYRKAIDSYYEDNEFKVSENELQNLKVLFNREFTNDYLYKRSDLFGQKAPNHLGIEIGDAFKYDNGFTFIKLDKQLNQFDGIRINDFGCIVNMLYKDDLLVNKGNIGDVICIKTEEKHIGKVYKTLDYQLENEITSKKEKKLPLNIKIYIHEDEKIKINASTVNSNFEYISEVVPQKAIKSPLTIDNIKNQFSKLNESVYYLNSIEIDSGNVFLPIKELNNIRRSCIEEFDRFRLSNFKRETIESNIEYTNDKYEEIGDIVIDEYCKYNDEKYDVNYVINRESKYSNSDNALICEIGGLLKDYRSKIAYYTLNCCNSYCYEFYKKLGFEAIILSTELSDNDIQALKEEYKLRNSIDIKPYKLSKGNRVLMYIKSNPFEKYITDKQRYYICDFNNSYLIRNYKENIEILENNDDFNYNKQMFIIAK